MLPSPTDVWMHDIRNSVLFDHVGRSFKLAAASVPDSKVTLHELDFIVWNLTKKHNYNYKDNLIAAVIVADSFHF